MNPEQKTKKPDQSGFEKYTRYSGMTFQMAAIILLFSWAGVKLDERMQNEGKLFTIILSLLGVFTGLYIALKDFINKKGKK